MKVMDYDSRRIVLDLFKQLIEWRRKTTCMIPDEVEFHWTELHLSIVLNYVELMCWQCEYRELPSAQVLHDTLRNTTPESSTYNINIRVVLASFMQELQEFFIVPRPEDDEIKKYQVVEIFISFLLQLLCNRSTDPIEPLKDQIDNLEKGLRFLRTVLGDTSISQLCDEHEQVNDLFEDFEEVANQAGSLVHALLFSTNPVSAEMDEDLGIVLDNIDILKDNIFKLSYLQPLSSCRAITPKTSVLDSLLMVESLLHDLEGLIEQEDNRIADVKDQIKMLRWGLFILQSSVKDIGGQQRSEIGEVKESLMRIGDMACEAEYLIVSFLVGDASHAYLIVRLTHVIWKIGLIATELLEIKTKYGIGALEVAEHFRAELPLQAKRNSKADVITVGLEQKEIHILDQLLGEPKHLQIISIVGMPGLGKTTFAKKLYSHPSVSYRFDRCSFSFISQSYNKKSVLLDILANPTTQMLNMGEDSLAKHLYKGLKGRRYFIVMDDIWDSNVWDDLKQCFPDDENGSRILITSRNKDVAPPNAIIYELPSLTNECWDLLEKKVFDNKPCPHELQVIGKKIAADCCGVPLAVVAVAGVLSTMGKEESQWVKVGENIASFIFDGGDDTVMQILELSYKHLPEHLKRCFLYFGVFLSDNKIPIQELMRLWIAEGFIITHKEQNKSAECVAEEYLMELIDKSLAIISERGSDGGVKACVVHDLLGDLCLRKCEEENFLKFVKGSTSTTVLSKSHRLIRVDGSLYPFDCRQNLRSFHPGTSSVYASNMKLLRVLYFDRMALSYAEHFFGTEFLVCLRYLCSKELSASISNLVNLEFLVVATRKSGVRIPTAILKMMKLRYLEVLDDATYDADCNSSQINNLEVLATVCIYNLRDEEMLKSSPQLRKLKCKCRTFWDKEKGAYRYPDLGFLIQLESLNIYARHDRGRAERISFPMSIKKLTLSFLELPWEKIMMAVGRLPKLEVLKLLFVGYSVTATWETRDGEFEQLKFLKLQTADIKQWNVPTSEHFPRLQQLVLIDCRYLQKIPSEIGEIASLQLIQVQRRCQKSLVESAENILQEQREMGNEELTVVINEVYHF